MEEELQTDQIKEIAAEINAELRQLPVWNTPAQRDVRRRTSMNLKGASPAFIFSLARELIEKYGLRTFSYELIRYHKSAFQALGPQELEELGRGIQGWGVVDAFGRTLSGPAWLKGQVPDELIHSWALSENLWWRRAALVSTVALNMRSHGGPGDVPRTQAVCRLLVGDHEDMIVKALSWALRELVVHDPQSVRDFLVEHDDVLAARVKREVRNKLETGLKNPRLR
jgi:3-methyladenine DNA glycosylase AlkD